MVRGCGALWGPATLNPLESFVSHLQPSHVCVPCGLQPALAAQERRRGCRVFLAGGLVARLPWRHSCRWMQSLACCVTRRIVDASGSPQCAPISADSPPRNPLSGLRFRQKSDEGFCCAAALHRLSIIPTAPSLSVNRVPKKASPFTGGGKQRLFNWPMRLCNPEPPPWVLARRRYLRNELTDSFLAPLCAGRIEASQARS